MPIRRDAPSRWRGQRAAARRWAVVDVAEGLYISTKRKWGAERDLEETARARGMMVTGGERAGAIDLHLLQARREGQQGVRSQVRSRHLRGTSRSRISLDSANWTELDHISPIKQPMSELDDISPINRIAADTDTDTDTDSFYTPSDNRNVLPW